MPGVQPLLVDEKGKEILGNNVEGNLCIKFPWPSMIPYNLWRSCVANKPILKPIRIVFYRRWLP